MFARWRVGQQAGGGIFETSKNVKDKSPSMDKMIEECPDGLGGKKWKKSTQGNLREGACRERGEELFSLVSFSLLAPSHQAPFHLSSQAISTGVSL
jgi:hypothetical protein